MITCCRDCAPVETVVEMANSRSPEGQVSVTRRTSEIEISERAMISLRAYFDSSGQVNDNHMTLAAFVANRGMWEQFETDWRDSRRSQPEGICSHAGTCPSAGRFRFEFGLDQ
jgi:hypothetical protein